MAEGDSAIWQGAQDVSVPLAMGCYLAKMIKEKRWSPQRDYPGQTIFLHDELGSRR